MKAGDKVCRNGSQHDFEFRDKGIASVSMMEVIWL